MLLGDSVRELPISLFEIMPRMLDKMFMRSTINKVSYNDLIISLNAVTDIQI